MLIKQMAILEILEHLQKKTKSETAFLPIQKAFFPIQKAFFFKGFFGHFYVVFQSMEETMQQ